MRRKSTRCKACEAGLPLTDSGISHVITYPNGQKSLSFCRLRATGALYAVKRQRRGAAPAAGEPTQEKPDHE